LNRPRFSIVVPTYQRPEALRNCLTGIAAITAPRSDFEVIVVDDCSDQDPGYVVDSFTGDLDLNLIRQERNRGPAAARNAGAGQARGDSLLFIDDDCIPSRDWLQRVDAHLKGNPGCAIGGTCRNGLTDNLYSVAQQMLMDYLYDYYNRDARHAGFCPTNNLAVPRQAFLDIGGFDTSFPFAAGEDREFSARWSREGGGLVFVRDMPVYHQHVMGFRSFMRMHFHYGRGARRFRKGEAMDSVHRGFEPGKFYWGLIVYPFGQAGPFRGALLCLAQILSQGAHTAGYLREALGE
jgi:glycosyltransferase involved in cell wall biosynthesis